MWRASSLTPLMFPFNDVDVEEIRGLAEDIARLSSISIALHFTGEQSHHRQRGLCMATHRIQSSHLQLDRLKFVVRLFPSTLMSNR